MAQTITLQRGELSVSSNTTTLVFTNSSSGTATRMIPGYLGMKMNASDSGVSCVFGVRRSGASAGTESVFAVGRTDGSFTQVNGYSFSPHDTAMQAIGVGGSSTTSFGQAITQGGLNVGAFNFGSSTPNVSVAFKHNNVMIGPSDEVYVFFRSDSGSRTATIQFCITLITES